MNTTPKGKIGRLPKAIQDQVNHRLDNGEKGSLLVAWLNSLPEVQAVLAAEFAGKPVREQNLSEWRKHGYKNWSWRREAAALAQEMAQTLNSHPGTQLPLSTFDYQLSTAAAPPPLTDQAAAWLTVRYLLTVRKLVENKAGGAPDLKVLREFSRDLVALRRGDQSAARLKMKQERMDRQQEKNERKPTPEACECLAPEIFGLPPKSPELPKTP